MNSRISFLIAIIILLAATALRLLNLATIPPGYSDGEIVTVRIAETAREGTIEVFYNFGGEGREGLYPIALAAVTALVGNGIFGYRIFSVWMNLIALALVYAGGRRLFNPLGGLAAMAAMAFGFFPIILSRQVAQETLFPLLVIVALVFLALAAPIYRRKRRRGDTTTISVALGVALAVGLYIHPIGIVIALFSAIFIAYMTFYAKSITRRRLSYIWFALVLMIILSVPYIVSTLRGPELGGVERVSSDSARLSLDSIVDSLRAFIVKGDPNPVANLPGRPLFDPISVILIIVGLATALRNWRRPQYTLLLIALGVLSPVYLFAAHSPDYFNYAAVLPILALFLGLGVVMTVRWLNVYNRWLAPIGLLALLTVNILWTVDDVFHDWSAVPETQVAFHGHLGQLAHYIDQSADDLPTVVCGWTVNQAPSQETLSNAQLIRLMLNRDNADLRYVDCYNALIMTNGGEPQQVIIPNPDILINAHPIIREWLNLGEPISGENIPANMAFYMDVEQQLADTVGRLTVSAPVSFAPEVGGNRNELINTPVNFGGNLTFLGYAFEVNKSFHPGEVVTVVTYWRADGMVPPDLRFFTHIQSDPGESPPANTDIINLDPRHLHNRDVFIQVTYVQLPESLPEGDYMISVGAYQNTSNARLDVLENGQPRGTRLFLYDITVTAN